MRPQLTTRFLVALMLAAAPALAASDHACEGALAKASSKFLSTAFKTAQRCLLSKSAGRAPAEACRLSAVATGNARMDRAMARAEARLGKGLQPCDDAELATMGFPAACPRVGSGAFTRADLNHCIASTHMAAVEALVGVQFAFPQQEPTTCGDGIVQDEEECDPDAPDTECLEGETCLGPGSADECTCMEQGSVAVCGDGIKDATEACDPAAIPTGCTNGQTCGAALATDACTCSDGTPTGPCQGTCTPSCGAGQTCTCECVSTTPVCGDGIKDATEACDPAAPNSCPTGQTCGAAGAADQCTCVATGPCGNGVIDPGEMCDIALPNNCDPGEECHPSGPNACMCGAPTTGCGNGRIEWGEDCDPAAAPPGCATGLTCNASCMCVPGGGTTTTIPGGTTTSTIPGATTTTVPGGTTTTTIGGGACCGPERIVLTSSAGTLQVDNLPPFPFPTGVSTVMDVAGGATLPNCQHNVVVPNNGFTVPNFDIPALNYCSSVINLGCESGAGEGAGLLWDGNGAAGVSLTNVTKVADTSDGVCNPPGQPCNTGAGGAGANTQGDVDSTKTATAAATGVRSAIDLRVHSLTWSDSVCSPAITPGCCPGSNYNPGDGDLLITEFDFILSPTTGVGSGAFVDKNGDGCKRAGSGFDTAAPGQDGPKTLTGTPAAGPCCVVGQATTVVSVGVGFSGGAPLFDLGFKSTIPNTVSACGSVGCDTCVVTTDPCLN